jgi:hypothetical protein
MQGFNIFINTPVKRIEWIRLSITTGILGGWFGMIDSTWAASSAGRFRSRAKAPKDAEEEWISSGSGWASRI